MRALVGVTDGKWAAFLRERPQLTEANFWVPSGLGGRFRALQPGDAFAFKTHHPDNKMVGGGFLSGAVDLHVSEAWDTFAEANGVSSREELLAAIRRYRLTSGRVTEPDPVIGCVLLRDIFFVPDELAVDGPPDFARSIVRWKGYDLADESGSYVEQALAQLLAGSRQVSKIEGPMFDDPGLVAPRLGQIAFKSMVSVANERRCAITRNKVMPTLQAAHIRPVSDAGEHRLDNGLLLRSDVHILFDRGYLGIDTQHRLHVSPRLQTEFGNGQEFYSLEGDPIAVPARPADRPNREFVEWHLDERFLAS